MSKKNRSYIYLLVGLVAVVGLSFPLEASVNSYDMRIIINIGISMILAASLNLINGFTGQFSLGHAGFMAIGAYTASALTTLVFGSAEGVTQELLFLVVLLAGGITAAIAGLLIGIPSLRLKGDYLAIVTLGFGEIIRVILQNIEPLGGSLGISGIPRYTTFIWTFGILAVLIFISENLMRSTYGRGFLATRDDEIAAESVGVNTTKYKVIAFVIGAFFAGVAGGLYGHYNSLIRPLDFGFLKSVEIVVMVILGGMGSTWGVLLAAALLTYLPEALRKIDLFGVSLSDFRMTIYSLALILLMIFRPQGLLGNFNPKEFAGRFKKNGQSKKSKPAVS
ncbi:MAG: branched-chain amino acid ABC transporter permease [Ignavibacteriae bacterium]|nr:branched-chain amino acid ABC transporter permease [Ignavibacteriota bacterium]MCB9216951.1 branched-chain amino acid ABC transporter permease [Ignavibacteria bacterium]